MAETVNTSEDRGSSDSSEQSSGEQGTASAVNEPAVEAADSESTDQDLLDNIAREVRGQFDSARERLAESSGAFLDWLESAKARVESEVAAQRTARETAEADAQAAASEEQTEESDDGARSGVNSSDIRDAVAELDGADSQAELLSRLLEQSCRFAGRSALLLGAANAEDNTTRLEIWNAFGFDPEDGDAELRGKSLICPAGWEPVLAAEQTVLLNGDDAGTLAQSLDLDAPNTAVAIPFVLRDSAYAVLYADDWGADTFDIDAVQLACFVAAQSMECLTLRTIRPAATLIAPLATEDQVDSDGDGVTAATDDANTPSTEARATESESTETDDEAPTPEDGASATVATETVEPADSNETAEQEVLVEAEPASDSQFGTDPDTSEDDTAAAATDADPGEPDESAESAANTLHADQLSTPDHYESAQVAEPATEPEVSAPDSAAPETTADQQAAADEPATEPAPEDPTPAEAELPPTPDLHQTPSSFHIPAPPSAPGGGEWSLTPEAEDDTPSQGFRPENPPSMPAWSEKEAPASFVSVIEDAQSTSAPAPAAPATPAAPAIPSPLETQVVHTGMPTEPPEAPGSIDSEPETPAAIEDDTVEEPASGPAQHLSPSEPAAVPNDASGPVVPPAAVPLDPADSTRPPRPSALDVLSPSAPATPETASTAPDLPSAPEAAEPVAAPTPPTTDAFAGLNSQPEATPAVEPPAPAITPDLAATAPAPPAPVEPEPPAPEPVTSEVRPAESPEISPPPGPPQTTPGSAEVVPPGNLDGPGMAFNRNTPEGEDPRIDEARRLARLLVSELKLYNEDEIARGKRLGNIYQSLREDIDRSRRIYDERVDAQIRQSGDFLHEELVQGLANGDPGLLGM